MRPRFSADYRAFLWCLFMPVVALAPSVQSDPITQYIAKAKRENAKLYRTILTQYAVWAGFHVAMLITACVIHGAARGLYVWFFMLALPAFYALWTIMFFNYVQHVHADPW